jgi:hypothetical protein
MTEGMRGAERRLYLESEGTAHAHRGLEHHLAPVQLDDPLGKDQAQPAALSLLQRLRVDLREGLEQLALEVVGDAHPLIAHDHRHPTNYTSRRHRRRHRRDRSPAADLAAANCEHGALDRRRCGAAP